MQELVASLESEIESIKENNKEMEYQNLQNKTKLEEAEAKLKVNQELAETLKLENKSLSNLITENQNTMKNTTSQMEQERNL